MEYRGGRGEAPASGGVLHDDESEEEVQRRVWRGPVRCVFAVVKARQPARGSDSMVFTLSDGVCWGSGTTAACPA